MNKTLSILLIYSFLVIGKAGYERPENEAGLFPPAAGVPGSNELRYDDPAIVGWASGFMDYRPGLRVAESWQRPEQALGPAGIVVSDVVVLGRGGEITMTLFPPLRNGPGDDFAVFENSFSDTFLELGFVEVSSDGENFVRFPGYAYTDEPVAGSGSLDPQTVYGLAGKYRVGNGVRFDLQTLKDAHELALTKLDWRGPQVLEFSQEYRDGLVASFPFLDLENVKYVRIIDIVGDGSARDCEGFVIYDPYPTTVSAGFDLDGVAALNVADPVGEPQFIAFDRIPNQRFEDAAVRINAEASSGLPVQLQILEGPATITGTSIAFTGLGRVLVQATQAGDADWEPAIPQVRSFTVADELQYLSAEPLPNAVAGKGPVPLQIVSSSGLPVGVEINSGPSSLNIDPETLELHFGFSTGQAVIRAFQDGGERNGRIFAPANELELPISIVTAASEKAPRTYIEQFGEEPPTAERPDIDADGDGLSNRIEFHTGTDPLDRGSSDFAELARGLDANGRPALVVTYRVNPAAWPLPTVEVGRNLDFTQLELPQVLAIERIGNGYDERLRVSIALPSDLAPKFIRLKADP